MIETPGRVVSRERGVVADRCPCCGVLGRFHVRDVHVVRRLAGFPIGRGEIAESVMRCAACHVELAYDESRYARVASGEQETAVAELVEATNPLLNEYPRTERAIEDFIASAHGSERAVEAARLGLLLRLDRLAAEGVDVSGLEQRLASRASLSAAERASVETELGALERDVAMQQAASAFLRSIARDAPSEGAGACIVIAWIALVAPMFLVVALGGPKSEWLLLWLFAAFIPALLIGLRFERLQTRRWIRRSLVPLARRARIDAGALVEAADRLSSVVKHSAPSLYRIYRERRFLRGIVTPTEQAEGAMQIA